MMKMRKNNNGKANRQALTCPHCGAGADVNTVGLFWDYYEQCWRCVICGYRGYECPQPRTKAEVVAERVWDEVLEALDKESSSKLYIVRSMN